MNIVVPYGEYYGRSVEIMHEEQPHMLTQMYTECKQFVTQVEEFSRHHQMYIPRGKYAGCSIDWFMDNNHEYFKMMLVDPLFRELYPLHHLRAIYINDQD